MTVAFASGKGGAGKTSLSAALAALIGSTCVVADCDVDAANGAIALGAIACVIEPYSAGPGFRIDPGACAVCGLCAQACRFGAIKRIPDTGHYMIVPELCERCGACLDACSSNAVATYEKEAGRLFVSNTRRGMTLVHAELAPGEDTSGKLVRKVRERADVLAGEAALIVVDAPPGIGCPLIASLSGSDLVVIVMEASASGIRDASRLIELLTKMKRNSVAIINKTGLDADMDARARNTLINVGIPVAGEVPFDPALRSIEESGRTWIDLEGNAGEKPRNALRAVLGVVDGLTRKNQDTAGKKERV